jgi:hypothetical protein
MDKEHARFTLRCFRPDGADAENPDFAEALAWAAKDRELGEWLARERAHDSVFANALNAVSIPGDLREEILAGLAIERGEPTSQLDAFDQAIIASLSAIQPPPGLRGEILAAMERSAAVPSHRIPWRHGAALAAAAGIALAFFISSPTKPASQPAQANIVQAGAVPLEKLEDRFLQMYKTPGFRLDLKNPDHHALFAHIRQAGLPCPSHCLPKALKDIPSVGCRELEIEGKRGILLCFRQDDQTVHLVIFSRSDVACECIEIDKPQIRTSGEWSIARWEHGPWAILLMGKKSADVQRLSGMF